MQRRLAAILVADVVGYSRLMSESEAATLAALKALRAEIIDPGISAHNGRIVKLMGDGALVEFASVVDAVACAAEIQDAMAARNSGLPEHRRIAFRIGINIGDVIADGEDIYGEGVNLAARMERLAEPGGICLSGEARRQVGNNLALAFDSLGEQTVKNIDRPVEVFRVGGSLEGAETGGKPLPMERLTEIDPGAGEVSGGAPPAIIVLPFHNLSGSADQEYFCDGLTQDITTDLSKFANLFVIAAHSAFTYKGQYVSPARLREEVGVRYFLEGSVQRGGERLRINAQLIDAESGHHIWAKRFDREATEVFELQDELIRTIVSALAVKVGEMELRRALQRAPRDFSAYDAFLRGSYAYSNETLDDLEEAEGWYRKAIEIDAGFARGWGELSYALVQKFVAGWAGQETLEEAGVAARRAVQLDDSDYFSHWNLGFYYLHSGQFAKCELAFREAYALNDNDADLLVEMGEALICMGEIEKGREQVRRALRMNPHAPDWYYWTLALGEYCAGDYAKARDEMDRMMETPRWSLLLRAAIYHRLGAQDEAETAMRSFLDKVGGWSMEREAVAIRFKRPEHARHWFEALEGSGLPKSERENLEAY